MSGDTLLEHDEPPAFRVERELGTSPFFLTCDHASARIPRRLESLGVPASDLQRHIAWDIGAAGVASRLAVALDAFLILQNWSRLVIDCNRPLDSPDSIVQRSEATVIPGNAGVTREDASLRQREIFHPYHDRIVRELDARAALGRPTILIAVHSFTPSYLGQARRWHTGLLCNRDRRLAEPLLRALRADGKLVVGDNEPYAVSDASDYAIPVYGERRGLLHVGIELRQDLIDDDAAQDEWAARLAQALRSAAAETAS